MLFTTVKSEGLAHNSYFLGAGGVAAVIDPRRDCDIYLDLSRKHNLKVSYIFETHRNEDYVSGSGELAEITGAEILHGAGLDFGYGTTVKEGDTFSIGSIRFEILETPGHTDESISIAVVDTEVGENVYMVFTGDALFAGDVGRTDLYGTREGRRLAEALYDSVREKLLTLGDGVIVCPAHGAGSVCGAELADHEYTTIGYEKKTNPVLQKNKEDFVQYKLNEELYRPPYFRKMEVYNKEGAPLLHGLPFLRPVSPQELTSEKDAQVVDVRTPPSFAGGHIPSSVHIWKDGLPLFAGWILNYEDPIILVGEGSENTEEIVRYLIRLGYDNLSGYLAGGFASWYKNGYPFKTIDTWTVYQLYEALNSSVYLLDVREKRHWEEGYIQGAHHMYVGTLRDHLSEIPDTNVVVYCDSGYKTGIATSLLQRSGTEKVSGVLGGIMAWKKAGFPLVVP
ncbi:MAG: MBL fold metallo-hydrolase [Theionarchaea archaeon]|nr:MBL fold metallo-hydrolase [Theionarchaea archaeon]MBU7022173.1 MBL fold metallo-hydrolase [Theionarchaea archaeon]MBU7039708.1 MBL fold metallo-hydrolase [Theionarchaea archaeon]